MRVGGETGQEERDREKKDEGEEGFDAWVTPSVEYAGLPFFTALLPFGDAFDKTWLQMVLEVRVRPGAFAGREASAKKRDWPPDLPMDPAFLPTSHIEWWVPKAHTDVRVSAILHRVVGPGAPSVFGPFLREVGTRVQGIGCRGYEQRLEKDLIAKLKERGRSLRTDLDREAKGRGEHSWDPCSKSPPRELHEKGRGASGDGGRISPIRVVSLRPSARGEREREEGQVDDDMSDHSSRDDRYDRHDRDYAYDRHDRDYAYDRHDRDHDYDRSDRDYAYDRRDRDYDRHDRDRDRDYDSHDRDRDYARPDRDRDYDRPDRDRDYDSHDRDRDYDSHDRDRDYDRHDRDRDYDRHDRDRDYDCHDRDRDYDRHDRDRDYDSHDRDRDYDSHDRDRDYDRHERDYAHDRHDRDDR
uniref:Uncharacterized protein n=1 Tax=Chromera velia CCMP2878 TaxID=1169474 RepID=A0A0G4FUM7_9ALVE|eukprot:Cvel_18795.t1-p1 / transcript=Cvel_18795.t1 / gene=Cvel_18795 / organism=Chromera_velia_CCMP2878 / gene_product=hypothetical protein / transcript_product=hypothetical protein / location=Cvel_scaffold1578:33750-35423(-) / protein_length=411 / sequence_SO=supercontig / SO=protein_coding / is_pseudo=false